MKRSHGLLSLFGDYGDLATASSDVKHTIAGIALSEDGVAFLMFPDILESYRQLSPTSPLSGTNSCAKRVASASSK